MLETIESNVTKSKKQHKRNATADTAKLINRPQNIYFQ